MLQSILLQFDTDGGGLLNENGFLEMMCPEGFLAYELVTKVIDTNGNALVYVEGPETKLKGWTISFPRRCNTIHFHRGQCCYLTDHAKKNIQWGYDREFPTTLFFRHIK